MTIYATRSQQVGTAHGANVDPLAGWFAGVQEALSLGGDGSVACAVLGRRLAAEGIGLGEALEGLRSSTAHVLGRDPSYAAVRGLSVAWADEMQGYLRRVSCEDPMTGLGSRAHLNLRLSEHFRGVDSGDALAALVVVDGPELTFADSLSESWWLVQVAERIRWALPGDRSVCRIGRTRLAVLADREDDLGRRVADLRGLVEGMKTGFGSITASPPRVWIEGLPDNLDAALIAVDELAHL